MGTGYVEKAGGAALNNCGFISTKNIVEEGAKPFCFLMDMSMVGVGVGFDARGAGKVEILGPAKQGRGYKKEEYVIPDTREGWVESLRLLIDAYIFERPLPVFVYDKIRKAGEPIRGFGGVASGPQPLIEMHNDIAELLEDRIGDTLSEVDLIDIGNLVGRCVVAGNVRRTAEITFGKPDNVNFRRMKQDLGKTFKRAKKFGIWPVRNSGEAYTALTEVYKMEKVPAEWEGSLDELRQAVRLSVRDHFPSIHHRWASNNSIFATVGMDYTDVSYDTVVNGEPGYEWLDNARAYGRMIDPPNHKDRYAVGGNPCLEQTLWNYELCTLVETFPARHESFEEFKKTLKIAYLYAKTVTLVPTHWPETNAVMMKNRRIGCSQSGIIRAFKKHGRRSMLKWCDMGFKYIEGLDEVYSDWLGVPHSIKKTSVKPSGTVSLLPGETPGIHYPHSRYYIRRIRLGTHSPLIEVARRAGYKVEPEIGKEDTSVVVEFPIKEELFERAKADVSVWEQVGNAVEYQRYWADNQVSITVTFNKEEEQDIKHILELNEDKLKGISFLPLSDHGYVQAPYEAITEEQYEAMTKDLRPIDFDNVFDHDELATRGCDGDACTI
jgi:hypothetical protein